MAFGEKFHISIQLDSSPSLKSRSFFSFTGTDDIIVESWVSTMPPEENSSWGTFKSKNDHYIIGY